MGSGLPLGTAQKPQRRVQRLPSIMKVADFWFQHSPRLGQFALSQTVCRWRSRASFFRAWKVSPPGARAFSHSGLRWGRRGVRSIWTSSSVIGGIILLNCIALRCLRPTTQLLAQPLARLLAHQIEKEDQHKQPAHQKEPSMCPREEKEICRREEQTARR